MSQTKIYVVEDDASIRYGLTEVFKGEGFTVESCDTGELAIVGIQNYQPDLVILDVMLPGKNGYDICKELRSDGFTSPILMLTAKGQEIDKVVGLDTGADDYVTKPFGVQELKARVSALLRRSNQYQEFASKNSDYKVGRAMVCTTKYETHIGDDIHRLTPKEMELLSYLYQNKGKVLSRDQILDKVWGVKYQGTTRTLDQCVAQLRKKIGDTGKKPEFLITVHGVGYQLNI